MHDDANKPTGFYFALRWSWNNTVIPKYYSILVTSTGIVEGVWEQRKHEENDDERLDEYAHTGLETRTQDTKDQCKHIFSGNLEVNI
jgi:hypothetical protein